MDTYNVKQIADMLNTQPETVLRWIRSGKFNTQLFSVIEECQDFLLVLSEKALDRCSDPKDWIISIKEYWICFSKLCIVSSYDCL